MAWYVLGKPGRLMDAHKRPWMSSLVCRRTNPSKGEADAGVEIGIAWVGGIPLIEKKISKVRVGSIPKIHFVLSGRDSLS